MQVVVDNSDLLTKAHKRFKTFTKNDELVELYEARQKYKMDRDSAIGYAEMKGIEQGIEQGENLKAVKAAKKMLSDGMSLEKIKTYTGLSLDEIKNL